MKSRKKASWQKGISWQENGAIAEAESLLRRMYQGSADRMLRTLPGKNAISSRDREELDRILRKGKCNVGDYHNFFGFDSGFGGAAQSVSGKNQRQASV